MICGLICFVFLGVFWVFLWYFSRICSRFLGCLMVILVLLFGVTFIPYPSDDRLARLVERE